MNRKYVHMILVPSHLVFHRCHHPCHKHLLDHLCQSLLVRSWEGWGSCPETAKLNSEVFRYNCFDWVQGGATSNKMMEFNEIPSCSDKWRWPHTQGSDWASRPNPSLPHKWSHLQRNRSDIHTWTWGRWSGWCRCTRQICDSCGSFPCMGSLAHTPKGNKGQVELNNSSSRALNANYMKMKLRLSSVTY